MKHLNVILLREAHLEVLRGVHCVKIINTDRSDRSEIDVTQCSN